MQNPPVRNSKPAPSFFRFTPPTFIVARDFFAKSWKLFDKTGTSAPKQPGKLSRLPLQVRLELIPGENFVRGDTAVSGVGSRGHRWGNPAPMLIFDLLQFLPLLVREIGRHLSMRFVQDFTDTLAGVASHLLELRGRFIEDRRYLGHLFRGQIEFSPQPLAHFLTMVSAMMKLEEKMPTCDAPTKAPVIPPARKTRRKPAINFHFNARFIATTQFESWNPQSRIRWRTARPCSRARGSFTICPSSGNMRSPQQQ